MSPGRGVPHQLGNLGLQDNVQERVLAQHCLSLFYDLERNSQGHLITPLAAPTPHAPRPRGPTRSLPNSGFYDLSAFGIRARRRYVRFCFPGRPAHCRGAVWKQPSAGQSRCRRGLCSQVIFKLCLWVAAAGSPFAQFCGLGQGGPETHCNCPDLDHGSAGRYGGGPPRGASVCLPGKWSQALRLWGWGGCPVRSAFRQQVHV